MESTAFSQIIYFVWLILHRRTWVQAGTELSSLSTTLPAEGDPYFFLTVQSTTDAAQEVRII